MFEMTLWESPLSIAITDHEAVNDPFDHSDHHTTCSPFDSGLHHKLRGLSQLQRPGGGGSLLHRQAVLAALSELTSGLRDTFEREFDLVHLIIFTGQYINNLDTFNS